MNETAIESEIQRKNLTAPRVTPAMVDATLPEPTMTNGMTGHTNPGETPIDLDPPVAQ